VPSIITGMAVGMGIASAPRRRMLLTAPLQHLLWWCMVFTAVAAAMLSIATMILDHRNASWPDRATRFKMHIVSYMLTTVSILIFVVQGLFAAS
jgi:hypothetical protein